MKSKVTRVFGCYPVTQLNDDLTNHGQ